MRKGFLASLALVLGHTSAQAQYYGPPQQPYYPAPNPGVVWVVPQAPAYYPQQGARPVYPAANSNYLPQGYFPAPVMQPVARPAAATPVPPEPVRTQTPANSATTTATPVARPVASMGPTYYLNTLPAAQTVVTKAPVEPVKYHRETCGERWWFGADYLMAWINQGPNTPLISTGSIEDTNPGALDEAGTIVLFGNRKFDYRMFHGARAEVGRFLDSDNRFSADANFFYLLPRHVRFHAESDDSGSPILSRPVFNTAKGEENIYVISTFANDPDFPSIVVGKTDIDMRALMMGGEVNGRFHSYCGKRLHTEILGGFRTIRLEESLTIRDELSPLTEFTGLSFKTNPLDPGDILIDHDAFRCQNQFYGFQVGGKVRLEGDHAYLDFLAKVALGVTDQQARIEGSTTLIQPGFTQFAAGGILAQPSNMGEHNRQVFGVIPEVGINMGADLTSHLRVKAGYSLLIWSGVTRPGLLLDRSVNPVQVPSDQDYGSAQGTARPAFRWREEVLFLQALNFGLEFHY